MTKAADRPLLAIVLDFDGVVLETDFQWMRAWQSIFADFGQRLEVRDWSAFVGAHAQLDPRDLLRQRGVSLTPDEAESAMTFAVQAATEMITKAQPRAGVVNLLRQAERADIPVAVATNGDSEWLNKWLPASLGRYIATAVTADDVLAPKPAPDLHRLVLRRLGLDPFRDAQRCVGIEDSSIGSTAVLEAGMSCVYAPTRLNRDCAGPPGAVRVTSLRSLSVGGLEALVSGSSGLSSFGR